MNKSIRILSLGRRWLLTVCSAFCCLLVFAQDNTPEMADVMRSNGKIYVVVAVCLTILIGLFLYVFLLDRKITKLENNKD